MSNKRALLLASGGGQYNYAVLDPNTASAGLSITNTYRTITRSSAAALFAGVLANVGKSAGKWYFEVKLDTAGGGGWNNFGITAGGNNLAANPAGWSTIPNIWDGFYGAVYNTGVSVATHANLNASGAVFGFAVDLDTLTVKIYNAVTGALLSTVTGITAATYYPFLQLYRGGVAVMTANFGATPFTITAVPTGYNAGWY